MDRLLLRRCPAGHYSRPDVLACDICRDADLSWQPASGRGKVISLAVDHDADTTVVVAELDEGPWLVTRLDGPAVARGDAVVVSFAHPEEGEAYPIVTAAPS
ncbi:Zn-ribbon domain-containing OB-fold protein [Pseudonocardia hispaniensis]|uniref:Zn-ribbon domain-containing OB-fold protein n=1 Tax=Pseudonocardia hispaniensis TaxID=904933 RepID=A0ABW1IWI1_9PSEU